MEIKGIKKIKISVQDVDLIMMTEIVDGIVELTFDAVKLDTN